MAGKIREIALEEEKSDWPLAFQIPYLANFFFQGIEDDPTRRYRLDV